MRRHKRVRRHRANQGFGPLDLRIQRRLDTKTAVALGQFRMRLPSGY